MKITWLGQAGLLFEKHGQSIMIDPYLSDSVEKVQPKNFRRLAVDRRFFDLCPDIMIFTHDHLDHYDPETAPCFLSKTEKSMTVLCPSSVWQKARAEGGGHNYVSFNVGTEWSEGRLHILAVPAEHSDPYAIGVVITDTESGKSYYIAGDTLYNRKIFPALPKKIDTVFLPVNGVGNNMNAQDAERFAKECGARAAVPIHFGMFDDIKAEDIRLSGGVFLDPYEPKEL